MKDYLIEHEDFIFLKRIKQDHKNIKGIKNELTEKKPPPNDISIINDSMETDGIFFDIYTRRDNSTVSLICTNQQLINIELFDNIVNEDKNLLFLSKHASKSNIPALTSHFTGNFSSFTPFGGRPFELGNAYPLFQKKYMKNLLKHSNILENYDITIESTHHGPTHFKNPMIFIEIGSTESEWNNKFTAAIVCKTILNTIKEILDIENSRKIEKRINEENQEKVKTVIGIGGNHYPKKFNNLLLFSNIAFASIISKHNIHSFNQKILEEMLKKSTEKIESICIDKNGLGKYKEKVLNVIKSQELEIISI